MEKKQEIKEKVEKLSKKLYELLEGNDKIEITISKKVNGRIFLETNTSIEM